MTTHQRNFRIYQAHKLDTLRLSKIIEMTAVICRVSTHFEEH